MRSGDMGFARLLQGVSLLCAGSIVSCGCVLDLRLRDVVVEETEEEEGQGDAEEEDEEGESSKRRLGLIVELMMSESCTNKARSAAAGEGSSLEDTHW